VVNHYEEALYQVYAFTFTFLDAGSGCVRSQLMDVNYATMLPVRDTAENI